MPELCGDCTHQFGRVQTVLVGCVFSHSAGHGADTDECTSADRIVRVVQPHDVDYSDCIGQGWSIFVALYNIVGVLNVRFFPYFSQVRWPVGDVMSSMVSPTPCSARPVALTGAWCYGAAQEAGGDPSHGART